MERLLICVALVLGCRAVQASSVAAVAQEQATQAAKASEGAAGPTKPGIADGASSPDEMGNRRPLYRLRKSDVIEIKFNFASEFNQTVSLQADGFIPLKGWDELYAQAMPELRRTIRQAYSECGPTWKSPLTQGLGEALFVAAGPWRVRASTNCAAPIVRTAFSGPRDLLVYFPYQTARRWESPDPLPGFRHRHFRLAVVGFCIVSSP